MDSILSFLEGKKTYITSIVTALIAGAQALGYEVPQWIYAILGAFGLSSLRAAIGKAR